MEGRKGVMKGGKEGVLSWPGVLSKRGEEHQGRYIQHGTLR